MDYESITIAEMRKFTGENRLRGYSSHRMIADLINFIENNYQPAPRPHPQHPTMPVAWLLSDFLLCLQLGLDQIDLDNQNCLGNQKKDPVRKK